jgi:hypothetical protein
MRWQPIKRLYGHAEMPHMQKRIRATLSLKKKTANGGRHLKLAVLSLEERPFYISCPTGSNTYTINSEEDPKNS